jgi:hypothetical protein
MFLYLNASSDSFFLGFILSVTSRSHKQEAKNLLPMLQIRLPSETGVVGNRCAYLRVKSSATIVLVASVYDLLLKTAFFDETTVSSFMNPISRDWFYLFTTGLSLPIRGSIKFVL